MSHYRTIEVSDPLFETGDLRFITVKTNNLRGRGDICVFVPPLEVNGSNVPVVILLHGVYGSAWSWSLSGGVHLQARELMERGEIPPMVIAMPSDGLWGDGSGYLPHDGYNFEKWIAEDIIAILSKKITGVTRQSPLFIGGLSMGGFGALRIGVKYGSRFKAISAHSSVTGVDQMKLFVVEDINHYSQPDKADENIFTSILKYRNHLPSIRFDCGSDDVLIEYNRLLHTQLKDEGIEHVYEEFAGEHSWPYWREHIGKSLKFFASRL